MRFTSGLALILHKPDEGIAGLQRAFELAPAEFSVKLRLAEELLKRDRIDAERHNEFALRTPNYVIFTAESGFRHSKRGAVFAANRPSRVLYGTAPGPEAPRPPAPAGDGWHPATGAVGL